MADVNPNLEHHAATDYDRREPRSGLIALVTGATIVVLVGMILGIYWLYVFAYEHVDQEQYSGVPSKQLEAIHAREADHLYKYAFIDKEKGVIRIPIDRAIDLVAAEYAKGTVAYNTKTYPVKVEGPGGAAAPPVPPAAPGANAAPAATAPMPATSALPAASTKQGH
jgi:hypothetical protein